MKGVALSCYKFQNISAKTPGPGNFLQQWFPKYSPWSAASASSKDLLGQILEPTLDLLNQQLWGRGPPGDSDAGYGSESQIYSN